MGGQDQFGYREVPALAKADEMERANGVVVAAGFGPELELGITFGFVDEHERTVRTIFLRGHHPMLPGLVTAAVKQVKRYADDPEAQRALVEEMLQRLLAEQEAVHETPMDLVHATNSPVQCPSCGRQLFGEIAARGACLSCYPELPPGGSPVGE